MFILQDILSRDRQFTHVNIFSHFSKYIENLYFVIFLSFNIWT